MESIDKNSSKITKPVSGFKLNYYYYVLELTGVIIPIFFGLTIIYFPYLYTWLEEPLKVVISLFCIAIIHATLFILYLVYKKSFIFNLDRYAYATFFVYFISITGGINSSFIFVLFFPLISSAIYLNKNTTRNIGIFITVSTFLMILVHNKETITYAFIMKDITQTILVATLAYYMYRVVIETLEQKYEKEQASKRLVEIVQIDRLKNDFLSVAQHQLRTPLSGVKWALETVESDKTLNPESLSLINAGLERVRDSITIINNMLKTAEDNSGNLTLTLEHTDVVGIVQSLIAELNFIALKKNIKVIFLSPQSLIIPADRDKFKAALNNIIDNAFKYSPNSTVNINIEDKAENILITIKDNGIGISKDDLPYIFDRLHRGKNAVMLEPDESGVGLYTSKRIIELHGGKISVDSELNKGTTVTVSLPK